MLTIALVRGTLIPRTTFVINKNDKIVAVFSSTTNKISPDEHVKRALDIVKTL